MRQNDRQVCERPGALDATCDAVLLRRLGAELASVYGDTLQAPLPASLRAIVERLEAAMRRETDARA